MCGIACIINNGDCEDLPTVDRFIDAVAHRGPDGRGMLAFDENMGRIEDHGRPFTAALGHRRLSILDLSEAGAQPMYSDCGNYVIVFNGEIYNYIELAAELKEKGFVFKSHCDTEVLLAAYKEWGPDCLSRFNGMWSFSILDRKERKLFISRDRIGVKPLYYFQKGRFLALASEIKQFRTLKSFRAEANTRACLSYLATGYEVPPETFYKDVYAFPPAHYAVIDIDDPEVNPEKYWHPENIEATYGDQSELSERIKHTFLNAVKFRLRSDVPVGGCLSGGLDSSSIFVMMKELNPSQTFNAFSACFNEPSIDERRFMSKVVKSTGSNHVQVFPEASELAADIGKFLSQHDEPVGSISMYAQYRVMKAAREKGIPVLLDGQGGDELFSGYWAPYLLMLNSCRRTHHFQTIFRHLASAFMPWGNFDLIKEAFKNFKEYRRRATGDISFRISEKYLEELNSTGSAAWHLMAQRLSTPEYRMAEITRIHLPRLLKWEDRNSMAFSIESRVPFLDVNLVELMLSIKPEMNMHNGWTKFLFRKAMDKILPDEICWRRDKKGFETPQSMWMKKGPLHEMLVNWALSSDHPAAEFLGSDISGIADALKSGNFNQTSVFRLFCLDYWFNNIIDG